jgi:TPR repeat protein
MNALGFLHAAGLGTVQDYQMAIELYVRSGTPLAHDNLGDLYYHGRGLKQSFPWAAFFYYKAARGGSAAAQASLGTLYAKGQGLKQDDIAAIRCIAEPLKRVIVAKTISVSCLPRAAE